MQNPCTFRQGMCRFAMGDSMGDSSRLAMGGSSASPTRGVLHWHCAWGDGDSIVNLLMGAPHFDASNPRIPQRTSTPQILMNLLMEDASNLRIPQRKGLQKADGATPPCLPNQSVALAAVC